MFAAQAREVALIEQRVLWLENRLTERENTITRLADQLATAARIADRDRRIIADLHRQLHQPPR